MTILIGVFVLVLGTSLIAWFAMSNAARKSDADKVRARLEATPAKKESAASPAASAQSAPMMLPITSGGMPAMPLPMP